MRYDSKIEEQLIKETEVFFEDDLGFKVSAIEDRLFSGVKYIPDHYFSLKIGIHDISVILEVKSDVAQLTQLKGLLDMAPIAEGVCFLTALSISKGIKEKLKKIGIGFLEIEKDFYFPINMLLKGKKTKRSSNLIKHSGFKAASNIKLFLYFVCRPSSLALTQRELADQLDLSLGAVNKGIKNLEKFNLIKVKGRKKYLGQFIDLVDQGKRIFKEYELEDNFLGFFSPIKDDFFYEWPKDLTFLDSYWGKENAVSIRTNYLSPELFTIYTYNNRLGDILKELRLKKDPKGRISIIKCFWPAILNNQDGTVPDFITYCELLNSGIDRNKEAAHMLEEKLKEGISHYEY